jgi:hypothetical protein
MPSRLTVVLVSLLLGTPAVIFWLWLEILSARAAILCPEGCECDPGKYYVTCYESSLNNIPLIFPTNVRQLRLHYNNITSLGKDSFISKGLIELEELTAIFCGLEIIEMGAFNGLTKLTALIMSHNEISEITQGTFDNMRRLEYLNFQYNKIKHLEVDVFSGLINLIQIDLRSNKLQYLHPDTFAGVPNLDYIDLADNLDLQIQTDRHFINSHSLSRLSISNCSVSSVSVETFANVTALERLDLRDNNLRSVDINILKALPKLSALYLSANPLQCDCQLQEVWRWCQDHNIQTASGETAPECETPSEVQGMWWGVLEKGQCLQGNIYYYGDYKDKRYRYIPIEDTHNDTGTDMYTDTYNSKDIDKDSEAYHFVLSLCLLLLYAALFIFGTTGNVILLIIITCNKDMRTVPNMYILNLAISDLFGLTLVFSLGYQIAIYFMLIKSHFITTFILFWSRLSVGLSAYSVAVLSIQRYRVTVNSLHVLVSSQPTWRATAATICGVWIVAALFALPSGFSVHFCTVFPDEICITHCQRVVLFELLVSCVVPLCVIAVSYIMTARHLVKSAQPISEGTQTPQLNTRTNTAKIVLGLTVVFLISYVPFHVMWIFLLWTDRSIKSTDWHPKSSYAFIFSMWLLLISPCFNPVALFCTSLTFRRQFKRYLTCCCKANPTATDIELTRRN